MTIYNNKAEVVAALRLASAIKPTKLQLRKKREKEYANNFKKKDNNKEYKVEVDNE